MDLSVYFSPKWVHIEETLMKLNIYTFFNKRWWIIRKIWEKVKNSLKEEFDSEPIYNEKYLKDKIKSTMENGKSSMEKSPQIKHQKKVLNLFVYQ